MAGELWWPTGHELRDKADDDNLWAAYTCTTCRIWLPGGAVDVRSAESPAEVEPPAGPLHVISGCDPASQGRREHDETRHGLLLDALAEHVTFRAEGRDPSGVHREPSVAVAGLSDDSARTLGRRFGQVAVFVWRGPLWTVLATTADRRSTSPWEMSAAENGLEGEM